MVHAKQVSGIGGGGEVGNSRGDNLGAPSRIVSSGMIMSLHCNAWV